MTGDHDDPDHPVPTDDPEARARALQSLLVEKEKLSTDAVEWLLADGTAAVDDLGYTGVQGVDIEVKANTPDTHNVIVCTLCSCYPWPVLGLPPTWYKSPPYRSKVVKRPRRTLREAFDLDVPEDTEIGVWDSSSEIRYMVLPQRPDGTEGLSETELAELVTRDSMIGVERLGEQSAEELA